MSRHFDDLYAVLEFDALDDFGQLIFALRSLHARARPPTNEVAFGKLIGPKESTLHHRMEAELISGLGTGGCLCRTTCSFRAAWYFSR